jgi:hypothetical protein
LAHKNLVLTITPLDGGVRRVSPSMTLKVHFAAPRWQCGSIVGLVSDSVEELPESPAHTDPRHLAAGLRLADDSASATQLFEHHWCRTTAAITIAEKEYTLI